MGRRSDHTRAELEAMFVQEGWRQLSEVGLAGFSAREVAKQIGYSIGTLYNVFDGYDGLMLAINARTLSLWAADLRKRLACGGSDRIASLIRGYFDFAAQHPATWSAIYEHRMAGGAASPSWYQTLISDIIGIAAAEIAAAVPRLAPSELRPFARSLIATVHGHCLLAVFRTFDTPEETELAESALSRVREAILAADQRGSPAGP